MGEPSLQVSGPVDGGSEGVFPPLLLLSPSPGRPPGARAWWSLRSDTRPSTLLRVSAGSAGGGREPAARGSPAEALPWTQLLDSDPVPATPSALVSLELGWSPGMCAGGGESASASVASAAPGRGEAGWGQS